MWLLFRFNGAIINDFLPLLLINTTQKNGMKWAIRGEKKNVCQRFHENQSDNQRNKNHTHIELNRLRSLTYGKKRRDNKKNYRKK